MHVILIRLAKSGTCFRSGWQCHAGASGQVGNVVHVLLVKLKCWVLDQRIISYIFSEKSLASIVTF